MLSAARFSLSAARRSIGSEPDFTSAASLSRVSRSALRLVLGQEPIRTCRDLPLSLKRHSKSTLMGILAWRVVRTIPNMPLPSVIRLPASSAVNAPNSLTVISAIKIAPTIAPTDLPEFQ